MIVRVYENESIKLIQILVHRRKLLEIHWHCRTVKTMTIQFILVTGCYLNLNYYFINKYLQRVSQSGCKVIAEAKTWTNPSSLYFHVWILASRFSKSWIFFRVYDPLRKIDIGSAVGKLAGLYGCSVPLSTTPTDVYY